MGKMSASGAIDAAPRIPKRNDDSVGVSGAGGLKVCDAQVKEY